MDLVTSMDPISGTTYVLVSVDFGANQSPLVLKEIYAFFLAFERLKEACVPFEDEESS